MTRATKQISDPIQAVTRDLRKIANPPDHSGRRLSAAKADLGTQVVHSDRLFTVELPCVVDETAPSALASAVLVNTRELTAVDVPSMYSLAPGAAPAQLRIRYAPTTRGTTTTEVAFVAVFADGHNETQRVPVVGHARELTDPTYADDFAPVDRAPPSQQPSANGTEGATSGSVEVLTKFNNSVGAIFDAQKEGVAAVEREQRDYVPPPLPKPLWAELVGIALEVGLAMVGGELGMLAGSAVEHLLEKSLAKSAAAVAKRVEKLVETTVEKAGDAAKFGEIEVEPSERGEAGGEGEPISYDPRHEFFNDQIARIGTSKLRAQNAVIGQMSNLISEFGSSSSLVTDALNDVEAHADATSHVTAGQARITTAQWMKYLARAELATVTSGAGAASRTTTVMADVRNENPSVAGTRWGTHYHGVVEIFAEPSADGATVTRARCNGLSKETAARVLHMNLREARVPIVIRYRGTTITIDEAGRIRAGGLPFGLEELERFRVETGRHPEHNRNEGTEVREAHEVAAFAEAVIARPLVEQGVSVVETDDHGGRHA